MKIKLNTSFVSETATFNVGDVVDWDSASAIGLIEAGYAIPVVETKIERAVAAPAAERRKRDVATSDGDDASNQ